MRIHSDLVDKAATFLRHPREAHELADHLYPDRADRDLAAKRRSGHAVGNDLIARGVAVKLPDGTYAGRSPDPGWEPQEPAPAPLAIEDGVVFRVTKEAIGPLAAIPQEPPTPQPTPAAQPSYAQPAPYAQPMPQPLQYAPVGPTAADLEAYDRWARATFPYDGERVRTLVWELNCAPLHDFARAQKSAEVIERIRKVNLAGIEWARAVGSPVLPLLAWAQPAPAWAPAPSYAPAWSSTPAPWASQGW